jgi:hypothetical protein
VDRCSDQGALPHVVAAQALMTLDKPSAFVLGADIEWPDGEKSEVDLYGFVGAEILAGEVKTSSSSFTHEQIDRDIGLSQRLGADRHVMACMEPLPDRTLEYARLRAERAAIGLSVIAPIDAVTVGSKVVR